MRNLSSTILAHSVYFTDRFTEKKYGRCGEVFNSSCTRWGGVALFAIYLKSLIDQKQYSLRLKMEKLEELYQALYEIKNYTGIGSSMIMATFSGQKSLLEQKWDHHVRQIRNTACK